MNGLALSSVHCCDKVEQTKNILFIILMTVHNRRMIFLFYSGISWSPKFSESIVMMCLSWIDSKLPHGLWDSLLSAVYMDDLLSLEWLSFLVCKETVLYDAFQNEDRINICTNWIKLTVAHWTVIIVVWTVFIRLFL